MNLMHAHVIIGVDGELEISRKIGLSWTRFFFIIIFAKLLNFENHPICQKFGKK